MTKRIISFILVLATLLCVCAVTVNAANGEEFISEVALVYEDSVEDAKAAIAGTDWKLWEQDLNPNADYMIDDGVYLIYKTSTNVEDAITDLRVMDMYGGFSTSNYEKQLEASREEYLKKVSYICNAAGEFAARYAAGDEMAKIAYRQMNYYKDMGETNLSMGDFMLNIPSDEALVTVLFEGNGLIVTNLITLLAVGISGENSTSLATRIAEKYAVKDTLTDEDCYEAAEALVDEFKEISLRIRRYDALAEDYDLEDENMSEEEYVFLSEYASIAMMLEQIPYGETNLKDFIAYKQWGIQDLYPIVAAFSEAQLALSSIGMLTTVIQYSSPSKPIEVLYELLAEGEKEFTDEDGNIKQFDVYMGVDRSIFDGNFAFTNAAERQQALTGTEWTFSYYNKEEFTKDLPEAAVYSLAGVGAVITSVPKAIGTMVSMAYNSAKGVAKDAVVNKWGDLIIWLGGNDAKSVFGGGKAIFHCAGAGLMLASLGVIGVTVWYGYYNPNYTPIPDNMVDVRETDLGDKYVKYTVAKVFGDEEGRNADLNAYEGKEWIALYYTKDANAGKCLTPNFVYSDNDSTIARRHQGISMFGETKAFNLNSHVFSKNAPGVYVTMRYSTAKKAAADMPDVVGSMLDGAFYALAALGGIGIGIGATVFVQKTNKKKEPAEN